MMSVPYNDGMGTVVCLRWRWVRYFSLWLFVFFAKVHPRSENVDILSTLFFVFGNHPQMPNPLSTSLMLGALLLPTLTPHLYDSA